MAAHPPARAVAGGSERAAADGGHDGGQFRDIDHLLQRVIRCRIRIGARLANTTPGTRIRPCRGITNRYCDSAMISTEGHIRT